MDDRGERVWMMGERGCGWWGRGVVDDGGEGLWMMGERGCG